MIFLNAIDLAAVGVKASQFILSFSILVILHELGHFIPARLFKTRVEKFYLFFNPGFSLWKKKIGETEYGIGWIPFGGYVKISGMIDESMDKEQMKKDPEYAIIKMSKYAYRVYHALFILSNIDSLFGISLLTILSLLDPFKYFINFSLQFVHFFI